MKKPESPLAKLAAINSRIINWILKPFIDPARWAEYARRLKRIDVLIAEADSTWAKYARKAIPYTFEKAAKDVEDYMRKIEIERRSPPKWQAKTQRALTEQAIIDVSGGLQNGRKDIEKYFRLSQTSAASEINNNPALKGRLRSGFIPTKQQRLSEAEISDILREGLQDKGTPKGIQSSLEKKLRERFADEQVITIITKSGKPRTYSIETYAEIVARTRTREAQSMGTIATMQEFGQDLVRVSDHDTTTPICIPHEGKIYSISGDSKEYPKLEEIAPYHPNCYSEDTDIYTERGWVPVAGVQMGEKVLSLNPDHSLDWLPVVRRHKVRSSQFLRFHTRDFDLKVTPDHMMYFQTSWQQKINSGVWQFSEAQFLQNSKSAIFYRSSKPSEISYADSVIMGMAADHAFELCGWIIAEGSVDHNLKRLTISQSKDANPDKWQSIKGILDSAGIHYISDQSRFIIKSLYEQFKDMGLQPERTIPAWVRLGSRRQIELFLASYAAGDGNRKPGKLFRGSMFNESVSYFTTSKAIADMLGELLIRVGKRPSYAIRKTKGKSQEFRNGTYTMNHDIIAVNECTSQYATMQKMAVDEEEGGDAYCVSLERNHTLFVRRNGKVAWSGNCLHSLGPYVASRPGSERQKVIDAQIKEVEERSQKKLEYIEQGGKYDKDGRKVREGKKDDVIIGNLRKPEKFLKKDRKKSGAVKPGAQKDAAAITES